MCLALTGIRLFTMKPVFGEQIKLTKVLRIILIIFLCSSISTWTAIVDWKYSGVFYHPPAMTVGEMKCNLPLPRELWNALDAAAYIVEKDKLESSKVGPLPKMTGSLKDLISALMSDNWTYEATLSPAVLPMESLYMASIGMCSLSLSLILGIGQRLTDIYFFSHMWYCNNSLSNGHAGVLWRMPSACNH